jgi:uncharacterized RDD family membrane protein YckC
MEDGRASAQTGSEDASRTRRFLPFPARLLGGSARGARRVAEATGIDRAVEAATEEAIVRAVESPAVERALVRVLQGPAVEEAMKGALDSPAVERALVDALDSELVDTVWQRLLTSDEAQKLVERIAQAPEVRAALAAQSVGLLEDIARQVRRMARRLDDGVEHVARRLVRPERRTEATDRAGLVTRGLALALDLGVLNAVFFAVSVVVALVASVVLPGDATAPALVIGLGAWLIAGSAYLTFFWALAGQTPGMRFMNIRVEAGGSAELGARVAFRRLVGTWLAAIPLGAGFLGILFSERRHGLQDRIAGTDVVYLPERIAPWSQDSAREDMPEGARRGGLS